MLSKREQVLGELEGFAQGPHPHQQTPLMCRGAEAVEPILDNDQLGERPPRGTGGLIEVRTRSLKARTDPDFGNYDGEVNVIFLVASVLSPPKGMVTLSTRCGG